MKKWILGIGLILIGALITGFALWSLDTGNYSMTYFSHRLMWTLIYLGLVVVVIGLMICFSQYKKKK